MKIRMSLTKRLTMILWLVLLCGATSGWAQQIVQGTFTPGVPLDDSPNRKGDQLALKIQYLNGNGNLTSATTTIQMAVWNPAAETLFQAQNRKAKATAADINQAKLNGVTAATAQRTGWLQSPINGRWFWGPVLDVTVKGMAIDKKNKDAISTVKDPTKEGNGGKVQLQQGGGGGGSMYKGSMNGTSSGMSSGVDPFADPSLFPFGFYSNDGKTLDVATLTGAAGMTDSQILSALASQFNSLYSQSGFTADFNPATDTLSFDQLLDAGQDTFYMADTDTGIAFNLTLSATPTPEPSTLLVFGSGLLGVGGFLRRRLGNRS